jgi:phage-related protein
MYDFISLFLKGTTDFNNNGKVLNEWIADSVKITEDLEGIFDFEGDYPVKDSKNFSQYLVRGNILRSPVYDSRPEQLFRIRKTSLDSSGSKISVYAQAIARCDLMNDFVFGGGSSPLVPAGKTRKEAISLILGAVQDNVGKFHVGNLDTSAITGINLGLDDNGNVINYIDTAYTSPLSGILDNSDNAKSVYKAYGGEIIFNNFEVNMVDERGKDNSFIIKSGKNLQEFQQDVDDISDDFATVLIIKSSDGIYLPNNEVITSPNVGVLGKKYKVITCEDVSAVDDTPAALNVVYNQLRERGQKKFTEDGIDALTINNTVKFAQLKKTEQYKDYNILEKCELGNNVTIIYEKLNDLTVTARVTRIVYNPLALNRQGKILEVTIGNRKKANIVSTINKTTNAVNTVNTKTNNNTATIKKVKKESEEFQVNIEARADSIELSVTNLKNDTEASIEILDDRIQSKVSKGEFGSYIEQNVDSVVEAIKDATGTHSMTLDTNGVTIENGGLIVKVNGVTVFNFTTSGHAVVKDIEIKNTDTSSDFYRTLENMDRIDLAGDLHCADTYFPSGSRVYIDQQTLQEYIDSRIDDKI